MWCVDEEVVWQEEQNLLALQNNEQNFFQTCSTIELDGRLAVQTGVKAGNGR